MTTSVSFFNWQRARRAPFPLSLFVLFILVSFSKEFLSFDVEKIIGLCVLTFSLILFYSSGEQIKSSLISEYSTINQEFKVILLVTLRLIREVKRNWRNFYRSYLFVRKLFIWSLNNLNNLIIKWHTYKKKQLQSLLKEELLLIGLSFNTIRKEKSLLSILSLSNMKFDQTSYDHEPLKTKIYAYEF